MNKWVDEGVNEISLPLCLLLAFIPHILCVYTYTVIYLAPTWGAWVAQVS